MKYFSQLFPTIRPETEYTASLIQILTPYHDLFDKTNLQESTQIIDIYFTPTISKMAFEEMENPYRQMHSCQDKIIEVVMLRIVASSGKSCLSRKRVFSKAYDLYNGISLDEDLRPMFSQWLLPQWVFTGDYSSFLNRHIVPYSIPKIVIKNMCRRITGTSQYEDKTEECIFNLSQGLLTIVRSNKEVLLYFEEHLKIKMGTELQAMLPEILKRIFLLANKEKKIGFVNLLYAIKENPHLPGLESILNLYE